jgi:hypothetical protein
MQAASSSSRACGINDHDTGAEPRQPDEVRPVERQQVRHSVDMTDRHEASVMNLFADDAQRFHKCLPCRVNVRRVRKEGKDRPGSRRLCLCVRRC